TRHPAHSIKMGPSPHEPIAPFEVLEDGMAADIDPTDVDSGGFKGFGPFLRRRIFIRGVCGCVLVRVDRNGQWHIIIPVSFGTSWTCRKGIECQLTALRRYKISAMRRAAGAIRVSCDGSPSAPTVGF